MSFDNTPQRQSQNDFRRALEDVIRLAPYANARPTIRSSNGIKAWLPRAAWPNTNEIASESGTESVYANYCDNLCRFWGQLVTRAPLEIIQVLLKARYMHRGTLEYVDPVPFRNPSENCKLYYSQNVFNTIPYFIIDRAYVWRCCHSII
jgi:hypothetical protein